MARGEAEAEATPGSSVTACRDRQTDKIKIRHVRLFAACPNRPRPQYPESEALVAQSQSSGRRKFSQPEEAGTRPAPAYRLRVGTVSQHWRMLGPSHRDLHVAGRYLHPALRLLRGPQGSSRSD